MASSDSASQSSPLSEEHAISIEGRANLFVYQPLETYSTIRILEVQSAAAFADPLVTSLDHRPLRDISGCSLMQDFIAVSYTWGREEKSEHLNCQGALISITPTVDGMLRRFRRPYKTQRLWIDAICLNQSDHGEKSSQIPQMRNIYQSAKKVFVWLREPADPEQNPLDTMSMLMFQQQTSQQRVLPGISAASVKSLLDNAYWTRRWVIQEISSHPHTTLHLGDRKFPWKTFTSIMLDLEEYRPESESEMNPIRSLVDRIKALNGASRPMLDLLLAFHAAECSDPRDRLAALQDAAKERLNSEIKLWKVDYGKDICFNYKRFAEAAIRSGYSKGIYEHLSLFGSLKVIDQTAPVWVPDWTHEVSTDERTHRLSILSSLEIEHISLSHDVPVHKMIKAHLESLQEGPILDQHDLRQGVSWCIDYIKDLHSQVAAIAKSWNHLFASSSLGCEAP